MNNEQIKKCVSEYYNLVNGKIKKDGGTNLKVDIKIENYYGVEDIKGNEKYNDWNIVDVSYKVSDYDLRINDKFIICMNWSSRGCCGVNLYRVNDWWVESYRLNSLCDYIVENNLIEFNKVKVINKILKK